MYRSTYKDSLTNEVPGEARTERIWSLHARTLVEETRKLGSDAIFAHTQPGDQRMMPRATHLLASRVCFHNRVE